jgi:hypothetical protein
MPSPLTARSRAGFRGHEVEEYIDSTFRFYARG